MLTISKKPKTTFIVIVTYFLFLIIAFFFSFGLFKPDMLFGCDVFEIEFRNIFNSLYSKISFLEGTRDKKSKISVLST